GTRLLLRKVSPGETPQAQRRRRGSSDRPMKTSALRSNQRSNCTNPKRNCRQTKFSSSLSTVWAVL
ncbi:hypothetical protein, partial [Peribacillus sp. NPDC058002]|uniref:hypothetical protein n=1 Tax=Peribacillus sp. NPDC058002 TaxID=3346301 RepID=UPI0036DA9BD9